MFPEAEESWDFAWGLQAGPGELGVAAKPGTPGDPAPSRICPCNFLFAAGHVVVWGSPSSYGVTEVPGDLEDVVQVSVGGRHALALRGDGTVVGWGDNAFGQATGVAGWSPVGTGVVSIAGETLSNVVAVAAGRNHSLALKTDGSAVAWGSTNVGQVPAPELSGITAVAAGPSADHSLAIRNDGTVVAWGANSYGQCDVPPNLPCVLAASAGSVNSLVLVDPTDGASPPFILRPPIGQTLTIGSTGRLFVAAAGRGPLTYQWRHGAEDIPGATLCTLTFRDVRPADSGAYSVTVSNAQGTTASLPVFLGTVPEIRVFTAPVLRFPGGAGHTYPLDYSPSLGAPEPWPSLATVLVTNSLQIEVDESVLGQPQRFYRSSAGLLDIGRVPALSLIGGLGSTNRYRLEYFDAAQRAWLFRAEITITSQPQYYLDLANMDRRPSRYRLTQL